MDTLDLHHEVSRQMPQLSDDEIDAAMNDPRLNDYYDATEDVWAAPHHAEEEEVRSQMHRANNLPIEGR